MNSEAGLTFVEVVVAALLIGVALVPLMQLYPQILEGDLYAEQGTVLGVAGAREMEELINRLRADINGATSGAAPCTDVPSCRIEWTIATEASSGTQGVGSLKTVSVTACVDANGNSVCDASEHPVRYDAKVTSRP
jgi:Tfp pilus assembly protein PilV